MWLAVARDTEPPRSALAGAVQPITGGDRGRVFEVGGHVAGLDAREARTAQNHDQKILASCRELGPHHRTRPRARACCGCRCRPFCWLAQELARAAPRRMARVHRSVSVSACVLFVATAEAASVLARRASQGRAGGPASPFFGHTPINGQCQTELVGRISATFGHEAQSRRPRRTLRSVTGAVPFVHANVSAEPISAFLRSVPADSLGR